MHPSIIFGLVIAGVVSGAFGYAYYKGNQACVSQYEYNILQAKVKRQELQLAMYRNAKKQSEDLSKQSEDREGRRTNEAKPIEDKINQIVDNSTVCAPADFVRSLAELRHGPNGKKQNSRSAFKRKTIQNQTTYKDLGPQDTQKLLLAYELNEQRNIDAIIASRRYHKRIQKIYSGQPLTSR